MNENPYINPILLLWDDDIFLCIYHGEKVDAKKKLNRIRRSLFGKIFKKTAEKMKAEYEQIVEIMEDCIEKRVETIEQNGKYRVVRHNGMAEL